MLEAAVSAGVTSEGIDALRVGVLPTPAVAYLTRRVRRRLRRDDLRSRTIRCPTTASRSSSPVDDKLDDAGEDRIQQLIVDGPGDRPVGARHPPSDQCRRRDGALPAPRRHDRHHAVGWPHSRRRLRQRRWIELPRPVRTKRPGRGPSPSAGNAGNGLNINDGCGSTHLDALRAAVLAHGADLGIAHDGDADRDKVDATGEARRRRRDHGHPCARNARGRGTRNEDTLVATVMSNMGLHLAMQRSHEEICTQPKWVTAT